MQYHGTEETHSVAAALSETYIGSKEINLTI